MDSSLSIILNPFTVLKRAPCQDVLLPSQALTATLSMNCQHKRVPVVDFHFFQPLFSYLTLYKTLLFSTYISLCMSTQLKKTNKQKSQQQQTCHQVKISELLRLEETPVDNPAQVGSPTRGGCLLPCPSGYWLSPRI